MQTPLAFCDRSNVRWCLDCRSMESGALLCSMRLATQLQLFVDGMQTHSGLGSHRPTDST